MIGEMTTLGHRMSELPLEPQLAAMLLNSQEYHCSNEVSYIHIVVFNVF